MARLTESNLGRSVGGSGSYHFQRNSIVCLIPSQGEKTFYDICGMVWHHLDALTWHTYVMTSKVHNDSHKCSAFTSVTPWHLLKLCGCDRAMRLVLFLATPIYKYATSTTGKITTANVVLTRPIMQSETELFNYVSVMNVIRKSIELWMSSWKSGILFSMLRALRRVAGRSRVLRCAGLLRVSNNVHIRGRWLNGILLLCCVRRRNVHGGGINIGCRGVALILRPTPDSFVISC